MGKLCLCQSLARPGPGRTGLHIKSRLNANPTSRGVCVQYHGDVAYAVYGDQLEKSGKPFLSRVTKADCEKLLGQPTFKGSYSLSTPGYRWENLQLTVGWPEDSPTEDCPMFTLEPVSSLISKKL